MFIYSIATIQTIQHPTISTFNIISYDQYQKIDNIATFSNNIVLLIAIIFQFINLIFLPKLFAIMVHNNTIIESITQHIFFWIIKYIINPILVILLIVPLIINMWIPILSSNSILNNTYNNGITAFITLSIILIGVAILTNIIMYIIKFTTNIDNEQLSILQFIINLMISTFYVIYIQHMFCNCVLLIIGNIFNVSGKIGILILQIISFVLIGMNLLLLIIPMVWITLGLSVFSIVDIKFKT